MESKIFDINEANKLHIWNVTIMPATPLVTSKLGASEAGVIEKLDVHNQTINVNGEKIVIVPFPNTKPTNARYSSKNDFADAFTKSEARLSVVAAKSTDAAITGSSEINMSLLRLTDQVTLLPYSFFLPRNLRLLFVDLT